MSDFQSSAATTAYVRPPSANANDDRSGMMPASSGDVIGSGRVENPTGSPQALNRGLGLDTNTPTDGTPGQIDFTLEPALRGNGTQLTGLSATPSDFAADIPAYAGIWTPYWFVEANAGETLTIAPPANAWSRFDAPIPLSWIAVNLIRRSDGKSFARPLSEIPLSIDALEDGDVLAFRIAANFQQALGGRIDCKLTLST